MRVRELNFSNDFVGYCFGLAALTEVPVIIIMPRLYRKLGHYKMLFTAGFATALRLIICLFASDIKLIIAAQLLEGLAYMTVYFATVTYVSENLPDDSKSFGQGLLAVAQTGFGSILGCVGGGLIGNSAGITTGYGIFGFLILIVTVVSMTAKYIIDTKKRKKEKVIE
jgi:PPP family 3-phenylpropionic acid transporter